MAELHVQHLRVALGDRTVIQDASLRLGAGELVALLGPNGAGKTTLLRAILGLAPRLAGIVTLGGRDPGRLSALQRARVLSYLPQARPLAWPVRVRDVVALGRFAHGVNLSAPRGEDARAIERTLRACDLEAFAQRRWDTLSGGELSRTHVARALAAQAPMLFADEPTVALDPLHQYQIMSLLRAYVDAGNAALVVLHDVSLAARFADRLAWIKDGRIVADGPPGETLSAARFAEVYGVRATVRRVEGDWFIAIKGSA